MKTSKIIYLTSFCLLINGASFAMEKGSTFCVGDPFIKVENSQIQFAKKTYKLPSGGRITLLGAMHFGEAGFYESHEEIFLKASHVLYEGKGHEEAGLKFLSTEIGKKNELLTNLCLAAAEAFGLCYQSHSIDYSGDKFIHADYTFDELVQAEAGGFDSFVAQLKGNIEQQESLYKDIETDACRHCFELKVTQLREGSLKSFCEENLTPYLLMTEEELVSVISSEGLYEREVTNRNKIVLEKLALILDGDINSDVHIVIYYGAAHLPCFERELSQKYLCQPESEEWFTAVSY